MLKSIKKYFSRFKKVNYFEILEESRKEANKQLQRIEDNSVEAYIKLQAKGLFEQCKTDEMMESIYKEAGLYYIRGLTIYPLAARIYRISCTEEAKYQNVSLEELIDAELEKLKEEYLNKKPMNEKKHLNTMSAFQEDLQHLINKYSLESGSDTPDFILAEYLTAHLKTFNVIVSKRDELTGKVKKIETDLKNSNEIPDEPDTSTFKGFVGQEARFPEKPLNMTALKHLLEANIRSWAEFHQQHPELSDTAPELDFDKKPEEDKPSSDVAEAMANYLGKFKETRENRPGHIDVTSPEMLNDLANINCHKDFKDLKSKDQMKIKIAWLESRLEKLEEKTKKVG